MGEVAHSADAEMRAENVCPEPALWGDALSDGSTYRMPRWAPHDWRLIEERRTEQNGKPYARRWYCTRCRLVEETRG